MQQNMGRLLKIASNQMSRDLDRFAEKYGSTGTQMSIIDYLSRHPQNEVKQHELEQEFNIQRSTTTVLLQRMEKKGLIIRKTSATDSRQKAVALTPAATKLSQAFAEYLAQEEQALTQSFSPDELALFERFLNFYIARGAKKHE
ncbi:MAG: MarR family transcriptional regulator [Lactobacillaceae bacterium]|jgi:DNA-binding MarR family transcriptional regulator|nr:MarR family transcriptional regulator [Lactobacillaceae bacterium]